MTEPVPKPGDGQPIVFFDLTLGGEFVPVSLLHQSYLFSSFLSLLENGFTQGWTKTIALYSKRLQWKVHGIFMSCPSLGKQLTFTELLYLLPLPPALS